jgi:hypothetical protein
MDEPASLKNRTKVPYPYLGIGVALMPSAETILMDAMV